MSNIIDLGAISGNALHLTPEQLIEIVREDLQNKDGWKDCNKMMVCFWSDGDQEAFSFGYRQAGMKLSECISLLELVKKLVMKEMNME